MGDRIRPAQVAQMTSLSIRKVQEMAAEKKIPSAAKLGGVWTFDPAKVATWIRDQERQPASKPDYPPISTGEAQPYGGGSKSPGLNTEEAFERLMSRKRNSASTPGASRSSGPSSGRKTAPASRQRSSNGRAKSSQEPSNPP